MEASSLLSLIIIFVWFSKDFEGHAKAGGKYSTKIKHETVIAVRDTAACVSAASWQHLLNHAFSNGPGAREGAPRCPPYRQYGGTLAQATSDPA